MYECLLQLYEFRLQLYEFRLLGCVYSDPARPGERTVSNDKAGIHLTHIEDLKNLIQLYPPARNLSLSIARREVFDEFLLPGQFFDLLLYFLNTPVIKNTVSGRSRSIHPRIDSRLQPVYCTTHRLAELVCPLSISSPPEYITDIGAEHPKIHTILFVGHLVLAMFEPGRLVHGRG